MRHRLAAAGAALACIIVWGSGALRADVSVTQGHIAGIITFTADFVPQHITVYAGNPLNEPVRFGSKVEAVLQTTQNVGATVVTTWSYDLTVEALLTTHYVVRPIAYVDQGPVYERVPFPDYPLPPAAPLVVTAGATTPFDIAYQPVIVTGSVAAVDMNGQPLPLRSIYLNAFDAAAETIQPDCVGSINFCLSAPNTNTAGPTYTLYLKPGRLFQLYSQAVSFGEDQLGAQAYNAIEFNDGDHLDVTANAPGDVVTKNYTFTEQSRIEGALQLNVPAGFQVYNKGVTVSGQTLTGKTFFDQFYPSPFNPAPTYVLRLLDFVDFSKPMSVTPNFQVSADGASGLIVAGQTVNVANGQQATVDFAADAGVLNGSFTFVPPYKVTNRYPGVQVASTALANSFAPFVPDPVNGGHYSQLASNGTWSYWRFGWNFNLGDPNFAADYFINNYLNLADATIGGLGDVATNDFVFHTALLKVYFTAQPGTVLSDPQLDATVQDVVQQLSETAHGEGFNQANVTSGEARLVLRVSDPANPATFTVNPTAIVNGSRVTFGPFTVTPHSGEVIVVGVPANIHLTLTSPLAGSSSANCQFTVTGTAGGGAPVASVAVNGQSIAFAAAPLPGDPNRVTFSATAPAANGTIVVVATDVNGQQVSQTVAVVCPNPCATDTTPPAVAAQPATAMLWPPNHNLVNVGLAVSASDACTAHPSIGVGVFSNEDDQEDTGEGNFSPDAKSAAPGTLRLRSERKGNGTGRVYLIVTTAADAKGNAGRACSAVVVPHDQGAAALAAVNAKATAAVASCVATGAPPAGYAVIGDGPAVGPKQ